MNHLKQIAHIDPMRDWEQAFVEAAASASNGKVPRVYVKKDGQELAMQQALDNLGKANDPITGLPVNDSFIEDFMTETTPQGGETWEEFLAEDVEYTKLNQLRSELDDHIRNYEGVINDIEWRLLGKLETLQIMQTKLIELEEQEKDDQAGRLERIQGVIDENSEDRFGLCKEEAGKAARHRLDMKIQWDRVNNQCGERWESSTPTV